MCKKYTNDKDINKLINLLIKEGVCTYKAGKKHGKLIFENGRKITVSKSPSDYRAFENFKHDVNLCCKMQ